MTDRSPVTGLRALLNRSLDYAGLFPPAKLPLETVIQNYLNYGAGPDAWFLSRLVCPVNRLNELNAALPEPFGLSPVRVSALVPQTANAQELFERIDESLEFILSVDRSGSSRVQVDSIEVPLPADPPPADGYNELGNLILYLAESAESSAIPDLTPFFETTDREPDAVRAVVRTIARHNADWKGVRCHRAAFKVRTGGLTADAFPTVDQLCFAIIACFDSGVRFKCTAGLHHPFRQRSQSVATNMHGFLNVFCAAVLIHAGVLAKSELAVLLGDESPEHFSFDDNGFAWKDARATLEEVSEARYDLIVSFGSCSFDEPLSYLRELGLL